MHVLTVDRLVVTIIAEIARIVNDGFLRAVLGIATGEILFDVKMQGSRMTSATFLSAVFTSASFASAS